MSMAARASRLVSRIRPQASPGSEDVPAATLIGWYARKGVGPAVRGLLRLPTLAAARLPLFVGKGARISYGNRLFLGRSVQIGAGVVLNAFSRDGVHLATGVTIRENGWIQCTSHPANPGVGLWIGTSTYVGPRATIGAGGPIRIGSGCQLGANVTLISENHATGDDGPSAHEVVRKGIRIGDGCWLGHGVSVLDGVTLGAGCVVGAGAVVTTSFPAHSRIAGVPARAIGSPRTGEND